MRTMKGDSLAFVWDAVVKNGDLYHVGWKRSAQSKSTIYWKIHNLTFFISKYLMNNIPTFSNQFSKTQSHICIRNFIAHEKYISTSNFIPYQIKSVLPYLIINIIRYKFVYMEIANFDSAGFIYARCLLNGTGVERSRINNILLYYTLLWDEKLNKA